MKIVYIDCNRIDYRKKSIFLAGPSPRKKGDLHWRPDALSILQKFNYDGQVFVPLTREGKWLDNEAMQIDREINRLDAATCIAFWVPRHVVTLPGFTTNVEYGRYLESGKIVLGYPPGAHKMGYMTYLAEKFKVPVYNNLEETLAYAMSYAVVAAP